MSIPEVDKYKAETELGRRVYYNWSHLFYALVIVLPFVLWGRGYIFTDIKDVFFLTISICVVYEIYCLRCDLQYYGELWRRNLK
jgi:hypothetical protein